MRKLTEDFIQIKAPCFFPQRIMGRAQSQLSWTPIGNCVKGAGPRHMTEPGMR